MLKLIDSNNFTVQARLSPLLRTALEAGAITPDFAAEKVAQMKVKSTKPEEIKFWAGREEQFRRFRQ